jgi:hypothetical protein
MRRLVTFVVVAVVVAVGGLYWLHDGDLAAASREVATAVGTSPDALAGVSDLLPARRTVAPDPALTSEDPPTSNATHE